MLKKGRCTNIGACKSAGKVFEIETDDKEFVCPDCEEPLEEVKEEESPLIRNKEKRKKQSFGIIIGIVIVFIAIIAGCVIVFSGGNDNSSDSSSVTTDSLKKDSIKADTVIIIDTLKSIDTLKIVDTVKIEKTIEKETTDRQIKTTTTTTKTTKSSGSGTIRLSYGTYTGPTKGGLPHGIGKLVYSTSRQINKYDTKGRVAQPGDYVQGEFVNGFFTIGKHFNSAGQLIESINAGAPDGAYESK